MPVSLPAFFAFGVNKNITYNKGNYNEQRTIIVIQRARVRGAKS